MLFYAALTVAGVIVAAIVVWMLRSLMDAGRSAYRTLSPSARAASDVKLAHLNTNLAAAPAPWGWGSGKGAPGGKRFDSHRFQQQPQSPSKSRDFSQLEAYARSNEKMKVERDVNSPHVGSVRNVLTGYDMNRNTQTDTSCWPYRDNLTDTSSSLPKAKESATERDEQPTKPWGW